MLNAQWLLIATQRLAPHPEARTLARLLLDAATGTRYAHLVAPDEELSPETLAALNAGLERAHGGEPLPYVLGSAPFYRRQWRVESGVLIPRSETELLVEAVLEHAPAQAKVADLGTGSGIIAGTLALERPDWRVFATELSPSARAVAQRNWDGLGARVQLIEGAANQWLRPIEPLAPFDAIVSNPPYIPSRAIEGLQSSVRDFEPRLALDGGADGLDPYREIAARGRALLHATGFVALEVGHDQKASIEELFSEWARFAWRSDLQGIARVALAWKS